MSKTHVSEVEMQAVWWNILAGKRNSSDIPNHLKAKDKSEYNEFKRQENEKRGSCRRK